VYVVKLVTRVPIVEIDQDKGIYVLLNEAEEVLHQDHLVTVITLKVLMVIVTIVIIPDIRLLTVDSRRQEKTKGTLSRKRQMLPYVRSMLN
jgi:membrane protein YdbS with pleckstrin-like domain